MTTTTSKTALFLLSILQDRYNHHKGLADSYQKMAAKASSKKTRTECEREYKEHHQQAIAIFCDINELGLMEADGGQRVSDLRQNYEIYAAKKAVKESQA